MVESGAVTMPIMEDLTSGMRRAKMVGKLQKDQEVMMPPRNWPMYSVDGEERRIVIFLYDFTTEEVSGKRLHFDGIDGVRLYLCERTADDGSPLFFVVDQPTGITISHHERSERGAVRQCLEHIEMLQVADGYQYAEKVKSTLVKQFRYFLLDQKTIRR